MACTSPNQWAMTPTSSSRSSLRQDENSDVDALEEPSEALLDHVRQLIVDLMTDRSSSLRQRDAAQTGSRDAKHSNNPEAEDDVATARERMLEDKLAHVLVELASEQENLRLAANAGNALLEELSTAREDVDALHDELEAAQLECDRSARDVQRLRDQNAALEAELQRYDVPWDSTGQQNALTHHQQLQQRRPSLSSRSGSFSRADSCERCASREVEVTQLSQRADELRRRCMELELARERDQQRERELGDEIAQLQLQGHEQQLETSRVQHDLEFATTQLEQRAQEVESVQAVRDTLRRTARRLEAENEELRARLAARDELVEKLEASKARAATQLQVAENRTKSAEAETKRATETLQQLQRQLENALTQKQRGQSSRTRGEEAEVEPLEEEARDTEQLLQDATREVAALRLENRILRRQSSTDASSEKSRGRGRRRKTVCLDSAAVTAADVLALDNRATKKETRASSASDSGSDTTQSQLPPAAIERINDDTTPEDGKKRRKMALELKWVDEEATDKGAPGEKPKAPFEPGMTEVDRVVDGSSTASPVKRSTAFARFNRANDRCVISGATAVNSPDVRLYGVEGKRSARVRELPIEELKREAAEPPPNSPLYLGLSFIACATAATAAGLLARR